MGMGMRTWRMRRPKSQSYSRSRSRSQSRTSSATEERTALCSECGKCMPGEWEREKEREREMQDMKWSGKAKQSKTRHDMSNCSWPSDATPSGCSSKWTRMSQSASQSTLSSSSSLRSRSLAVVVAPRCATVQAAFKKLRCLAETPRSASSLCPSLQLPSPSSSLLPPLFTLCVIEAIY